MKKLTAIMCVTILMLILAACGSNSDEAQKSDTFSAEITSENESEEESVSVGEISEENATDITSMPLENTALDGDPFAIEQMLFDYFNNGGSLDTEALNTITGLRIYGTSIISVVCGSSVGSDKHAIISYLVESEEATFYDYATNEEGATVRVDYPIGVIDDIKFLKYCTNLVELEIYCNEISDISPVADLSKLTTLMLNYNRIEDISPIAGLSELVYVHFDGNDVSDLSCLAGLTNLLGVGMDYNNISDISSLANLSKLQYLNLTNNQITDISPIDGLDRLEDFHIHDNYVKEQDIHNFEVSHPKCFVN